MINLFMTKKEKFIDIKHIKYTQSNQKSFNVDANKI
jgi:hypothetical protein